MPARSEKFEWLYDEYRMDQGVADTSTAGPAAAPFGSGAGTPPSGSGRLEESRAKLSRYGAINATPFFAGGQQSARIHSYG